MTKPLVVLISGAPGAGKTTLGVQLSQYMRLPHVARDKIAHGLGWTRDEQVDRTNVAIPLYYELTSQMLKKGISLVTDGTIYKGISEADLREYILAHAFTVNVHVRASGEWERFRKRELSREGWPDDWVDSHKAVFNERYELVVDPLELGIPIVEVDASDGYNPSLSSISASVKGLYIKYKNEEC